MGIYTRSELEILLRDYLRVFCENNFDFQREITVDARVRFSVDDDEATLFTVEDTLHIKDITPGSRRSRYKGGRSISRKLRETPTRSILKPDNPTPERTSARIRSKTTTSECGAENDLSSLDIKTEEPYIEIKPKDDLEGKPDCSVTCPAVSTVKAEERLSPSDEQQDADTTDEDSDPNPEFDASSVDNDQDIQKSDTTGEINVKQSPGKHVCSFCGKVFPKPNRLAVHERVHTGDRPYVCNRCQKSYRSAAYLKVHKVKGCIDRRKKGAVQLLEKLKDLSEDEEDDEQAEESKRRECKFCERVFSKPSRRESHERTHTGERPFQCPLCTRSYTSHQGLRSHEIRGCSGQRKRKQREQKKKPPPEHRCRFCGKYYPKRARMLIHERTKHTGERPFLCATCGKSYPSKMSLNSHMLIHTKAKTHVCTVCNTAFLLPNTLKIHMRVHTGERPHVCWHCGRAFRQDGSFQVHLRTHTKEKPLKCSKCDQRFAHRSILQKHEMMHEGERKFSCTQCDKRFWTSNELKTHVRNHLGIRRYVCTICNMRFTKVSSLKRHTEGHTGNNKSHFCSVCGKSFTRAHQVTIHMKVHLEESPYRCTVCRTNFKSMTSRRQHMQTHHPEHKPGVDGDTSVVASKDTELGLSHMEHLNPPKQHVDTSDPFRTFLLNQQNVPDPSQPPRRVMLQPPPPAQQTLPGAMQIANPLGAMPQNMTQPLHIVSEPQMYQNNM